MPLARPPERAAGIVHPAQALLRTPINANLTHLGWAKTVLGRSSAPIELARRRDEPVSGDLA